MLFSAFYMPFISQYFDFAFAIHKKTFSASNTVNPHKERLTFSRAKLFLVLIEKVHMEISESKTFHRFLLQGGIPKLVGEQNLLSKTFTYHDKKLVEFIC